MLNYLLSNPPDFAGLIFTLVIFTIALSLHEYGHALAATLQGDPTARLAGRLTVNPKSHVDPFGALMLVLVGFGWGKPVPFAPNKLRSARWGAALVGIAGPLVNLILALISAAVFIRLQDQTGNLGYFLFLSVRLNLILMIFNLLPIPPLDGSRVLSALLPPNKQHMVYFLDKWGFVILLIVGFIIFPRVAGPFINSAMLLAFRVVGA